ncbi:endolytic transglycosylase MltG [Sphingomonas solaris]|uniref:Endolytic murein transglycosylase n=1 Tax=Alterirhizorhabdus solaris TaxID=2529389 RepID=A0A558R678_9SPHN|nr:endolytic transglycosylase MltG [Sphingomonas solaris]TVV74886.1 endolytic transglycosylase MltG [Sphingomonas solaris]
MARGRRRGGGGRLAILLLAAVVALLAASAGIVWWGWAGPGPAAQEFSFSVPEGATLTTAARRLEKAGAITSTSRFLRLARLFGSDASIRAGEYEVPAHASQADILALLQGGRTRQRFVTIPEGMPAVLVGERLAAEPLLTGPVPALPEGSVLPDSYSFEREDSRAAVVKRMRTAMDEALAAEWKTRKPTTAVKTPREALILASIVEKETALGAERRMVAAVYSNRLRTGMRLQADPTTIYPITKGKPLGRRIRKSELAAVNGYNTYAKAGLPEGPICNPGRAAIAAVLDPADSRALYFVADGKGGHVFAETLAQHNANVQRYYALRRAKGEM